MLELALEKADTVISKSNGLLVRLGYTPLHLAACSGNMETLITSLANESSVHVSVNGITPLHCAAGHGHVEVIEYLLNSGSCLNAYSVDGLTALHCAARNGHINAILHLLSKGAPVNIQTGCDHLYHATPLHYAALNGHVGAVQRLLANRASIEAKIDTLEYTPLHCAAKNGHTTVIRCLLSNGALINALSNKNLTPLFLAAINGHVEAVRFLINNRALIDARTEDNDIPLYAAAFSGKLDVLQLLLAHGALSSVDNETEALNICLTLAAKQGGSELLRFLLHKGAYVNSSVKLPGFEFDKYVAPFFDKHGTPLCVAIASGNSKAIKDLVEAGATIDQPAEHGFTPVHIAAMCGKAETLKLLVEKKSSLLNTKTETGFTPLHLASGFGAIENVIYLVKSGADMEAKDSEGHTPLLLAAICGSFKSLEYLVGKGACIDTINNDAKTPLHFAAGYGFASMVNILLQAAAKNNTVNTEGLLPIQDILTEHRYRAPHPKIDIHFTQVLLLRAHGDTLKLNKDQRNALHYLAKEHPEDFVHMMRSYFENRNAYLIQYTVFDTTAADSVFKVAAYFLDLPILTLYRDTFRSQLITWRDLRGRNLLMVALNHLYKAGVVWLLDGQFYDINAIDADGHNALWYAVENESLEFVNLILAAGGIPTFEHVECAVKKEDYRIMVLLITKIRCGFPLFR